MRERTGFRRARLVAALALGSVLASCSDSFEQFSADDDSNKASEFSLGKSIMTSIGAVDPDEKPVADYKPRAPLVVPPKKDLRAPENSDAALAAKKFPVNPEDRSYVAANDPGAGGATIGLVDQEKFANLPKSRPPKSNDGYDPNQSKALSPEVMKRGHGDALKQAQANAAAGGPYKRKSLTEPPDAYGRPNPNAPFEEEKPKESSWKPSWWPL